MAQLIRDPREAVLRDPHPGECVSCERYVTWRYYHTDYRDMKICQGCLSDFGGIPGGPDWSNRIRKDFVSWDALAKRLGYEVVQR